MARQPRDHRLETREARRKLPARKEPYWRQIVPGTFLGYYRGARSTTWLVRQRENSLYRCQRLATPDDLAPADGEVVLSYSQAVKLATAMQVGARVVHPRHYGDGLTLDNIMETYFRTHLTGKGSEKVARLTYGRHAGKFGTRLLSALTTDDLQRWHRDIATKPPTKRGKAMPFDPSDPVQVRARRASANRILSSVKAALNHAWVNDRLPPEQPVFWAKVKPFAVGDGPPPRMLERGEVKRLLDVASADLRNLLMGAFMTGARLSEARHMQVRDFDLRHKTIRIFQAKTGKTLLQPLTTEGEEFFIRMTKGRAPQEMIFLKDNGRPWGQSDADKPMRVAAKAADLEGVTFKTTRATYGKMLLLAARDIELVAKALGHSDSRVTRTHYAQYLPSEVARAVAQLPRLGITPVR